MSDEPAHISYVGLDSATYYPTGASLSQFEASVAERVIENGVWPLQSIMLPDGTVNRDLLRLHRVRQSEGRGGMVYSTYAVTWSDSAQGRPAGKLAFFSGIASFLCGAPSGRGNLNVSIDEDGLVGNFPDTQPPLVVGPRAYGTATSVGYLTTTVAWSNKIWYMVSMSREFRALVKAVTEMLIEEAFPHDRATTFGPNSSHQKTTNPATFTHRHFVHDSDANLRATSHAIAPTDLVDDVHETVVAAYNQERANGNAEFLPLAINPDPLSWVKIEDGEPHAMDLDDGDTINEKDLVISCFEVICQRIGNQYEVGFRPSNAYIVGKADMVIPPIIDAPESPRKRARFDKKPPSRMDEDDDNNRAGPSSPSKRQRVFGAA